jgi:hypothetical protein
MLFEVDIEGHGFALQREGRTVSARIMARRYVDAVDHDEAQDFAIELLSEELNALVIRDARAQPVLEVVAIRELAYDEATAPEQPPIEWRDGDMP